MDRRIFCKAMAFFAAFGGAGITADAGNKRKHLEKSAMDSRRAPADDEVKITFVGTSHGRITATRAHSCTVLQTGGRTYVIDAGDGAASNMMKAGINVWDVDAIFLTHAHVDHYGGMYTLQNQITSYRRKEKKINEARNGAACRTFLPTDAMAERNIQMHSVLGNGNFPNEFHSISVYREGLIFDDGNVKVTAYGNDHLQRLENGDPAAFSFLFECANGKKVFFSGDLNKCFDLPVEGIRKGGVDLLVCELVHYDIKLAVPVMKDLPVRKTIFQHHATSWETEGWEERFADFSRQLTMPAEIVTDGTVRFI